MNRRIFKSLTLWMVPLLLARALIPAGYMLMTGADGLQLMFCPGVVQMAMPAVDEHAHHAGHHAAADQAQQAGSSSDGSSGHRAQDSMPCPFALAAVAALGHAIGGATFSDSTAEEFPDFHSAPDIHSGPLRADRIRGPPLFS
ncbi:hypothetical protein HNQ60_002993 [Povalibacter uvarum]|uniref:DUF2946 domain-containing protein n=1 Tax=Povalibacter uvarum TaxID=732238 RepID=A0A841HPZ2_9GAMM|nr:hypothetical protein [Povalibacter uvarum]MBB6094112.1 hypothetical protein [Povalibacter uvarum]